MKAQLKPVSSPSPSESIERMLGRSYPQLVEWSRIIARGDELAAEETVQDLCLYLTVAQPDLSRIRNLDNYLYMCLRNMYVSNLARVSRERLRVIQVEDYDAVGMLAASGELDNVDVQNALIRICDYLMARKYSSKSASQFILHFFLGYRRSDVALLARLPMAAIYNKLRDIRCELREHLSSGTKIRLLPRGAAPESRLLRTAVASDMFLNDLRTAILDADPATCMAEDDLVRDFANPDAAPVTCQELAHLAGCERCLKVLERALQLNDHDGPLDGVDTESQRESKDGKSFQATMQSVRKRRAQLLERRPALLAIAVDGRVVAFHAVESAHNSLSSRVEAASTVRFIEVFDEFGDRLAHLPLEGNSAGAPGEDLSQQLLLSDNRRLRLDVRFDGLGIHAAVDYTDPALAQSGEVDEQREPQREQVSFWARFCMPRPMRLVPWGVFAFATIVLAAIAGISGYRYMHPGWRDVLSRAAAVAQVPSSAETLHQTLRIEQTSGPQTGAAIGAVDVWRSSDRRVVRRLYNAQQQLLATHMDAADGTRSDHMEPGATNSPADRMMIESGVWRTDVSTAAFSAKGATPAEAARNADGFEVSEHEDGRDGILMRTLVLDRGYRVQAERVRFRTSQGVSEVRLVQTLLRRVPNRDVPAWTFPQPNEIPAPGPESEHNLRPTIGAAVADASAANLEADVLFELFRQNADTGQPIDVSLAPGGHVRIAGTLANAQLLASLRERMATLPGAEQLDFQVYSSAQAASSAHNDRALRQELVGGNGDAPAAALVRDALLARGLKGTALQKAEQEFAASALAHAQTALQHAYALDRLGTILCGTGQSPLSPDTRQKWAQMADRHAKAALTELQVLRMQLDSVSAGVDGMPSTEPPSINDAPSFTRATSDLRARAEAVNRQVVELFAGSAAGQSPTQVRESVARLRASLPLVEADRTRAFAGRLTKAQTDLGEIHPQ